MLRGFTVFHSHHDVLSSAYESLGLVPQECLGQAQSQRNEPVESTVCWGTAGKLPILFTPGCDIHTASAWVRCEPNETAPGNSSGAPMLAPSVDVPHPETAVQALMQSGWHIAHADDAEAQCVHTASGLALTLRQGAASAAYVSEAFLQVPQHRTAEAQAQLTHAGMHVLFHSHSLQLPSGASRVPCVHLGCSTAPHAPSVTLLLGTDSPAALPCAVHMQPAIPQETPVATADGSGHSDGPVLLHTA